MHLGVSSVASIQVDWILSMKLCKINSQRPAKVNDIANKNVWIGAAKYRHINFDYFDYNDKYNFDFNSIHSGFEFEYFKV